jgi:hypothetical protein
MKQILVPVVQITILNLKVSGPNAKMVMEMQF